MVLHTNLNIYIKGTATTTTKKSNNFLFYKIKRENIFFQVRPDQKRTVVVWEKNFCLFYRKQKKTKNKRRWKEQIMIKQKEETCGET